MSIHMQAALAKIESQLYLVSAALIDGEPGKLQSVAMSLCEASREMHGLLSGINGMHELDQGFHARLNAVNESMKALREGLSRRTVLVERALHSMLPSAQASSYDQSAGTYGRPGRQSGAFKVLAA